MSSIRRIIERNISENDSCLNLYSYTGAFSLTALQKGAKEVHSVDLSESYLGILEKNIALNEFAGEHVSHATSTERAIEALKKRIKSLIILFVIHHRILVMGINHHQLFIITRTLLKI